jgi:hypothetical protein
MVDVGGFSSGLLGIFFGLTSSGLLGLFLLLLEFLEGGLGERLAVRPGACESETFVE